MKSDGDPRHPYTTPQEGERTTGGGEDKTYFDTHT